MKYEKKNLKRFKYTLAVLEELNFWIYLIIDNGIFLLIQRDLTCIKSNGIIQIFNVVNFNLNILSITPKLNM